MKILPLHFLLVHMTAFGLLTTYTSSSEIEGDIFCSSFCNCDMWFKLRRASCTSKRLYSIQTGVSNTVQALDLSHNAISSLLNYDLKKTGLIYLRYLNLSDNSINEIGTFAFSGIKELNVLDLSRNHLYYLLWDTFIDNLNLRILNLNGNRFGTRIPELHSPSITELSISDCQINYVNRGAFAGLKKLRKLDLSNNLMIQIDFTELQPLIYLKSVNLDNNPWSCGDAKQLESHLEDRKINFNPLCVTKIISNPGVKKFEKMIDASSSSNRGHIENREEINPWMTDPPQTIDNIPKNILKEFCKKELSNEVKKSSSNGFLDVLSTISPIWIFAVGFSLGIVTSMIGSYVWLTGMCSCKFPKIPRRNRDRISDSNSQRISLLNPTCPGTPPPPYRDVILNSSSYPTAPSTISI